MLFIDEIHRLKPSIEEILYIAMEDYCIDMVMPEGGNVRIPLHSFSLIGATTKMESLADPLKNRFVYKFHFSDYNLQEQQRIIQRYLKFHSIDYQDNIIQDIADNILPIPREINNFCVILRDYLITKSLHNKTLDQTIRQAFKTWAELEK